MTKNKILTAVLILIALTVSLTIVKYAVNGNGRGNLLETPLLNRVIKQSPSPMPSASSSAPKSFNFDRSTDLRKELNSINPQVLDSDFQ